MTSGVPTLVAFFALLYGATLLAGVLWTGGLPEFVHILLVPPLIWLSVMDLKVHQIPDGAVVAIFGIGSIVSLHRGPEQFGLALMVAFILLLSLWLIGEIYWRMYQVEALGFGDAKLIAAMTVCLGPIAIWTAILLACIGGIVVSLIARATRSDRASGIPFGPFLAYSLQLMLVFGTVT